MNENGGLANTREGQMELLPCPFCGGANVEVEAGSIECRACGAMGPDNVAISVIGWADDYRSNWNRRSPSPSLPAVPDVKEEEQTLEEPGDTGANTVPVPQMARQLEAKDDAIVALFEIVQGLTKADSQPRLKAFKIAFGSVGTPSVPEAPKSDNAVGVSSPTPSSSPATVREQMEVHLSYGEIESLAQEAKDYIWDKCGVDEETFKQGLAALAIHRAIKEAIYRANHKGSSFPSGIVEQPKKDSGEQGDAI